MTYWVVPVSDWQENEVVRLCLGGIEMARPLKLYNHAVAPNPRRVRIFAAEKGIEPAKAARPNSSQKTRPVGCQC